MSFLFVHTYMCFSKYFCVINLVYDHLKLQINIYTVNFIGHKGKKIMQHVFSGWFLVLGQLLHEVLQVFFMKFHLLLWLSSPLWMGGNLVYRLTVVLVLIPVECVCLFPLIHCAALFVLFLPLMSCFV